MRFYQCSGSSHSIWASKFWHCPFELHSNSQGADELKQFPISIDFHSRNTELLSCLIYLHALAQLCHNNYLAQINKYSFLACSHSELFCEIAVPKKIRTLFGDFPWWRFVLWSHMVMFFLKHLLKRKFPLR